MTNRRGLTVAVVQARMTSSRLPGKVLADLSGEPMLLRQLERISRSTSLDQIVVTTSDDSPDDVLAEVVTEAGYPVVRGSLDDVLGRFIAVIDEVHPEVVVRLTGDCPLTSPTVIDAVVEAFDSSDVDYLSNTMIPTYPDGLDLEVCTAQALRQVSEMSPDRNEREHVTLGIYRQPEVFSIKNFRDPQGRDNSHLRWTVDNADDLEFVRHIYSHLLDEIPSFDYDDILDALAANPAFDNREVVVHRNAALDGLDTGVMRHVVGGDY